MQAIVCQYDPQSLTVSLRIGVNDPDIAQEVLRQMEGMRVQLTGPQGVHITGLDSSVLSQPLHIDTSVISQLLQQNAGVAANAVQQVAVANPAPASIVLSEPGTTFSTTDASDVTSVVGVEQTQCVHASGGGEEMQQNEVFASLSEELQATVLALTQQPQSQTAHLPPPLAQTTAESAQPEVANTTLPVEDWSDTLPQKTPLPSEVQEDNLSTFAVTPRQRPPPAGVFEPSEAVEGETSAKLEEEEEELHADISQRLISLDDTHIVIQKAATPITVHFKQVRTTFHVLRMRYCFTGTCF